jgi:arginine decarboxylase
MIATPDSTSVQFIRSTAPSLPPHFEVSNGRLHYQGLDLLSFIQHPVNNQGRIEMPTTPMYVRYLPALRASYEQLHHWFQVAKTRTGFPGDLTVAFASKANPAEPVVRTLLQTGAAYECSSSFDVDLARHAAARGWLDRDRVIFANGFKIPIYVQNLIRLRAGGFTQLMPIFDDLDEIAPFAESGLLFDVGVRSRTDANYASRFGMVPEDLEQAAMQIMTTNNLRLTTFHAMQTIPASRGLLYQGAMIHSLRIYARLRRVVPTLYRFDLGGGLPGRNSDMDFQDWMIQVLQNAMAVCQEEEVPTPDLVVESGRYLTQDHACKMFRIVKSKLADDGIPFYMIDGSIMSNFPDAWALGDSFTVLPINHWDGSFGAARLAGLTCDPDDVYPTHRMTDVPLELPVDVDGLIVGFFDCGAYQEMLGGRHGAKHCLLPEGPELIVDHDGDGSLDYSYQSAQTATQVLGHLGYSAQP